MLIVVVIVLCVLVALLIGAVLVLGAAQVSLSGTLRTQIRAHERHMGLHRVGYPPTRNGWAAIEEGELETEVKHGD